MVTLLWLVNMTNLFFSPPSPQLFNTLTTCHFLDLEHVLSKIDLSVHHKELLKYISLFHQNNRSYRAFIIAEKLLACGLYVPEKDYEFIFAAQKSGHILGLNKPIKLSINHEKKMFTTEGAVNHQSLTFLIEKINAYLGYIQQKKAKKRDYDAFILLAEMLNKTIQKIYPHTHLYKPDSAKLLYEEYLNNQFLILTSGWKGHTIGIGVLNGALVVCNRGPGTLPGKGTNIYPILHPELMTEEWFKKIIDLDNKKNILDLNSILSQVVDLNSPKITFPSNPQKHKNCSYANIKSLLEGMLYLLSSDKENILENIDPVNIKNRKKYKNFTAFARSHELFSILKKINLSQNSGLQLSFYKKLLQNNFSKKKSITEYHFEEYVDELKKDSVIFKLMQIDASSPLKKNTSHLK